MKKIGERIKNRRILLKMQLNDLAARVGITSSALSQIEKAKAFPSIITLKSIADNLHTTVGFLIGENDSLGKNPVVRGSEVNFVQKNASGTEIFLLSHHDINKQMDTYLVKMCRDSDLAELFTATFGETFCFILAGKVCFTLEEKTYSLAKGDSIYFNCRSVISVKNMGKNDSRMLWVISPPNL